MSDPPRPQRIRILLIDDEPLVARVIQRILAAQIDVVAARTGEEALECLQGGLAPEAVLSDVHMVGMSGCELFENIQRDFPALVDRFAFMSGSGADAEEALRRYGRPMLAKPAPLEVVRQFVQQLANGEMKTAGAESFAPKRGSPTRRA